MRTTTRILTFVALLSTLAAQHRGTQSPQDPERYAKMSARHFRKLTVPGEEVARNVERLTSELRWHNNLSSALAAGRAQRKPVVWIQALGDLKGFL